MTRRLTLSDFDEWAQAHHGLITFSASGMSRSAWYRALRNGSLEQLHPYVARMCGTTNSAEQRIAAGVLAVDDSIASHRSAARLWGLPRADDDPVDLIAPRSSGPTALDGVIIHRPTDRARLLPQRRFGIRCSSILRTLLDLGAVDPDAVEGAVGHAISTRLVQLETLPALIQQHGRPGRGGVGPLRSAVEHWSIDGKPADSLLEVAMARLVKRFRLPAVEFHPNIEGFEVDFRVTGTRILLECDGWIHHGMDRGGFERDRERDAALLAAGWLVVRFTYRAVTAHPGATANRIRAAVDRWGSDTPGAASTRSLGALSSGSRD